MQNTFPNVLKNLIEQAGINIATLAKKIDLPPPTIHRLVTGEVRDPKISTLTSIANYFSISIDQLLGKEKFDQNSKQKAESNGSEDKRIFELCVLSLNQANEYHSLLHSPKHKILWVNQKSHHPPDKQKNIFSVYLKNNIYDPPFVSGTYLIINPDISPANGDHVLIKFNMDSEPVIKKYISEGHQKYLYPLKQDLKSIVFNPNEASLIGVIIELYLKLKD